MALDGMSTRGKRMTATIASSKIWSKKKAFGHGALAAAGAFLVLAILDSSQSGLTVIVPGEDPGWMPVILEAAMALVFFAVPILWFAVFYARMPRFLQLLSFGAGLGLAFSLIAAAWNTHNDYPFHPSRVFLIQSTKELVRVIPGGILFGCLLTSIAWVLCHTLRGPVQVYHDWLCPRCCYDLRGNTTGICPECGHAYTLKELGIREAS
jgi:hypothetical protein